MLLDLKSLFLNDGQSKTLQYDMNLSDIEIDACKPFISPVHVDVHVQSLSDVVLLIAVARFSYKHPCDRCLEDIVRDYSYSFEHRIVDSTSSLANEDYAIAKDYIIDLYELIRADVLLELPRKNLCKEDCKGLCSSCGINLNKTTCNCISNHIDPRLADLKKFID